MYINTFKYKPEDVSCVLCTEYVKKLAAPPCPAPALPSVWRPVRWAMRRLLRSCFRTVRA